MAVVNNCNKNVKKDVLIFPFKVQYFNIADNTKRVPQLVTLVHYSLSLLLTFCV